ncbi:MULTISPECIES: PIN/TRAM domain-containing protein [Moorena]|uniref:PIN/TRAM domain-containing protein n=1 Tax=Moorena TaxID=1155738 RepID=UPI0005CAC608|nr:MULTISPECIES: PIN/TRAM domain-containing protein [Moorena]NEQ17164.1 PIN/TRAM domain-containing protein [Moorena sp. SIO3E2]NES82875.1 PIN/TRAM domain-containing protein [Moorena sp. SIO2B7]NEP31945.1 PIN/TRAM domain-containing protein [Moorena sp. SIO3B2]NEP66053.1 PIN/TRAM domain-containing protein [Moorena sp. SIO3A5]NER87902.1 PIN/TRAM domain-containing protein [Moorena sp. SIO3A2]
MLDFVIILLFIIAAASIGFDSVELLPGHVQDQVSNLTALRSTTACFGAIIGLALGLMAQVSYRRVEAQVRKMPMEVILTRSIGLILGLLLANLMLAPIFLLPIPSEFSFIKPLTAILGSVMFSFLGVSLADTHGRTFLQLINPNSLESVLVAEGTLKSASSKIIDTSSIIDGRIEALLETGFIEGQILVSQFVLLELQQLADAANDQKRTRGRRGLDILNRMQAVYPERLVIHSADYDDLQTVDTKLVRFAQEINGTLLTNDYNLSKVANLQKVPVLNVNDLAQAVRPLYLPGDILELKILKGGKEPTQGVGYLDDGTMVVVEEGYKHMGVELPVIVTSALQTSAGRMIFARPKASVTV